MFKIERICEKISRYISQELNFDDDKRAVINYGIFGLFQTGMCIILVILFGMFFNVTIEAIIVSFTISILRKSSGGVHAKSPMRCAVIGTASSIGMALLSKNINMSLAMVILVGSVIFIWSYYIINKIAPVDSIAKPIKNIEKRKRLKGTSIKTLSFYLITTITIILSYLYLENRNLLSYILCVYMGLLWQVFSLTKCGHIVLGKLG